MPDEPETTDASGDGDLTGDLTARLKQLEERIATEPSARRRRTPVRPSAPHAFPPLEDDAPVPAVEEPAPPADAPAEAEAVAEAVADTPAEPPVETPAKTPANTPAEPPRETAAETPVEAKTAPTAVPVAKPAKTARRPLKAPVPPAPLAVEPGAPIPVTPARGTASPRPAAKKTAARKATAKKVPAKKVAVSDLGAKPAAGPWPVSQAPRPARQVPPTRPAAVPAPPTTVLAAPAPEPVVPVQRESDGVVRFLVLLAVLLLAAAAGMGAAAFVEHRDSTYKASTVVRLDAGPDPTLPIEDTVAQGMTTYTAAASAHSFTATAEQRAGVAASAVQGDVQAAQRAPRQITLTVLASTSAEATKLATGAGDAFVELVNLQEAVNQASAGDRLAAVVVGPEDGVVKTAPKARDAWIAALLAAGAVLVLAGVAALLRLTRRS